MCVRVRHLRAEVLVRKGRRWGIDKQWSILAAISLFSSLLMATDHPFRGLIKDISAAIRCSQMETPACRIFRDGSFCLRCVFKQLCGISSAVMNSTLERDEEGLAHIYKCCTYNLKIAYSLVQRLKSNTFTPIIICQSKQCVRSGSPCLESLQSILKEKKTKQKKSWQSLSIISLVV